jgi:flagellar L-ring protein FlgH
MTKLIEQWCGILIGATLLGGCVAPTPMRQEPMYKPVWPQMQPAKPASPGSLYAASHNLALFGDRRADSIGDVVTIVLEESTRSSKSAETSLKKGTKNEILNPKILGSLVQGTGNTDIFNALESGTEFSGEGESDQSNSLSGTLTAVVANVLPNGLLLVQGEKWFQLNRGEEYVRVSGLVRPEDINGDNTVSSQRLADARIAYSGTGEMAQANQAGWLTRFFLGTVFPF